MPAATMSADAATDVSRKLFGNNEDSYAADSTEREESKQQLDQFAPEEEEKKEVAQPEEESKNEANFNQQQQNSGTIDQQQLNYQAYCENQPAQGSESSETDSQEESKHPNYHRKKHRGSKQASKNMAASVPFTADNLIERPGKVLSSLFSQLSGSGNNSN